MLFANNADSLRNVYSFLGKECFNKGSYLEAFTYYQKCLKIDEKLHNELNIADVFKEIGNIYWYQANYPKALDFYLQALKNMKN